jgi:outer membrane protein TolC
MRERDGAGRGGRGRGGRRLCVAVLLAVPATGVAAQASSVPPASAGPTTSPLPAVRTADRPAARAPLTLAEVVTAALRTSPAVAEAEATAERAGAGVTQSRAALLPSLSADGSAVRFQLPMVVAPLHGLDLQHPPAFQRTLVQGALTLGWTLFDGGSNLAQLRRSRALGDAALADADAARSQLIVQAAESFLQLGSTREVLAAAGHQTASLAAEQDRAQRMLREGRAAPVAVLRAEAALDRARADSVAAAADVEVAERALARLMGVDTSAVQSRELATARLADSTVPDRAALLAAARTNSPQLASSRRALAAARARRAQARGSWLPRIQVVGRFTEYGSGAGDYSGEWQAGVQLSYPLFTGGARIGAVDAANAETRAAAARLEGAEQQLEGSLDQALASLRSASQRVAALAASVAQWQEVVRIERLSLDAGSGTQTDYLSAEAELYAARAALTRARAARIDARVALAGVTGELSPRWIASNLESAP